MQTGGAAVPLSPYDHAPMIKVNIIMIRWSSIGYNFITKQSLDYHFIYFRSILSNYQKMETFQFRLYNIEQYMNIEKFKK